MINFVLVINFLPLALQYIPFRKGKPKLLKIFILEKKVVYDCCYIFQKQVMCNSNSNVISSNFQILIVHTFLMLFLCFSYAVLILSLFRTFTLRNTRVEMSVQKVFLFHDEHRASDNFYFVLIISFSVTNRLIP